jgi:Cytochrome P460
MRILDSSLLVVSVCFVAVIGASSLPRQSARAESTAIAAQQTALPAYCAGATDHTLPLPTSLTPDAFHDRLLAFLQNTEYVKLNWCVDKGVRDTGPFVNGKYLGTHPAVRIYYSPTVMKWLINGREGELPDGAMMVKEMYLPPAARWEGQPLVAASWTVMIKDAKGSHDGWFWGGLGSTPPIAKPSDSLKPPFNVLDEGFGLSCVHCHASAEKEMTFATLNNVKGFPGNPASYFVDNTWRTPPSPSSGAPSVSAAPGHTELPLASHRNMTFDPMSEFAKLFARVMPKAMAEPRALPGETYDHVVPGPKGTSTFVTSDQCMTCHSGNAWMGSKFVMILEPQSTNPVNVSPYGEWRWSPMGLAGRDPVFYAQLDSELAYLRDRKAEQQTVINTCFRCHGVMGKRQLNIDNGYDPVAPKPGAVEPDFDLNWIYSTNPSDQGFKYGALARDGVSCAACHRVAPTVTPPGRNPLQFFLERATTGQFTLGPPDQIFGPFEDNTISTHPMKTALGVEPKYNAYVKDSRMCGSCHTVILPVMDQKPSGHSMEQVTYLEWLNSQFQTDFNPGPNAQSCQACHMKGSYANAERGVNIKQIQTTFADVQDDTYPAAEHLAPMEQVRARFRDKGFARHQLQGLNVFLLEMFDRFMEPDTSKQPNYSNDILGVRKSDYMSTLSNDLPNAISNFVQTARQETATIELLQPKISSQTLSADVRITNLTGHRLPSGVGFRRAFVEFVVMDNRTIDPSSGQPTVVWSSGRTNAAGVIVDGQGNPLPSEYIGTATNRKGPYQPHFYGSGRPITQPTQVQIFEELTKDGDGNFTTSFLRRHENIKDNRLLPKGWTATGPDPSSLTGEYLHATFPEGEAAKDPSYLDGSGTSVVRYEVPLSALPKGTDPSKLTMKATLYYQSIPPYYLMQRFEQAPNAAATQRLLYLTSRLDTKGTPIENWKLLIASTPAAVPSPEGAAAGLQRHERGRRVNGSSDPLVAPSARLWR